MAVELTSAAVQTVAVGQNVLFTETPVFPSCGCNILHREGSGIVTLRGNTSQCRALYKVSFGANITGAAAGDFTVAIALDGETLGSATATVTLAAAGTENVYVSALIPVVKGDNVSVSIENASATAVNVANANLIIERVA